MTGLKRRLRHAGFQFEAEVLEVLVDRFPDDLEYLAALAETYTRLRRYRRGLELDRQLVAREPHDPGYRYNLACSLALTGKLEDAAHELLAAIDLGYRDFDHLLRDPDLRRIRHDTRFDAVRARMAEVKERS